jgi:hypothetical protein
MAIIVFCVLGMLGGAFCTYLLTDARRRQVAQRERELAEQTSQVQSTLRSIEAERRVLDLEMPRLRAAQERFQAQVISYQELQEENTILKRDLLNVHIESGKLKLDRDRQGELQASFDQRARELGDRYLGETVKWISASLNQNNFSACKQRLLDVIKRIREIGVEISPDKEAGLLAKLKEEYHLAVRAAFEREEQARIKAQIREEQLREREIQRELQQLEREREAIRVALEKALAEAEEQHSDEVDRLRARLADAEAKLQRTISQAQLTKSGHVYVISNIGSFGEGVFKVGMTRRLDPHERVRELSSAPVPFPFDIHMMISCDDAPTLEYTLHEALRRNRINRANPRKEFFKTDLATIADLVRRNHGSVEYTADVEALEYRQSLEMPADDEDFIRSVYDSWDEEHRLEGVQADD